MRNRGAVGIALWLMAGVVAAWAAVSPVPQAVAASTKEQTASLGGDIPAGDRHVTRLRNLPAGAKLEIAVETDGGLAVLVQDESGVANGAAAGEPLFSGRTESQLEFTLVIPRTSTYYLILDNREGTAARRFSFDLRASIEADETGGLEQTLAQLERFEADLRQLLVFDDLDFRLGSCGQANAFSIDNVVVVCHEMGAMIQERVDDSQQALNVALFVMMHEIGHALLRQWNFPSFDNEEVADEFATVVLLMFGLGERVESVAEFFTSFDPIAELEKRRGRDSRHPLSQQRARNLQRWVEDPDLVERWQAFLVQHMQTEALQTLASKPRSWTDVTAIEQELARR